MAGGFFIALLLCSGDNCDLVQVDPGIFYSGYETCRNAAAKETSRIGEIASRHRKPGRGADVICVRDLTPDEPVAGARAPVSSAAPQTAALPPLPQPGPLPPTQGAPLPQAAPAPRPLPVPTGKREFRDCEYCPVMVTLPGGSFIMGSTRDPTERPPHGVTIAPFAIGKAEVSVSEWAACVAARACDHKGDAAPPERPMTNLSWDDAIQYAARAGTATSYPWGNEPGAAKANCKGCGGAYAADRPAPVEAFPPTRGASSACRAASPNGSRIAGDRATSRRPPTARPGARRAAPRTCCAAGPG
jgi:formylglycine-generating enzyme required for sulfatase activity